MLETRVGRVHLLHTESTPEDQSTPVFARHAFDRANQCPIPPIRAGQNVEPCSDERAAKVRFLGSALPSLLFDIRFPLNSKLCSAPSVNPACAAPPAQTKRAVLASTPLAGFGD
jgi:hypothetical protein